MAVRVQGRRQDLAPDHGTGRVLSEVVEEVRVPGATLWTASQGAGLPVVLCHGGPGLCDNLSPLAEMIDDLARVHRYDQRGAGRSHSDGPFDVATFVADLEALRRHWGHDRWVVGGHSWGANLALVYALAHTDRTLGVVYLSGSGLRPGSREDALRTRLDRLTEDERTELARLEPLLPSGDAGVTERFLRLMWTTDFADRETATRVLDAQPLYRFPRNEHVHRAVSRSFDGIVGDEFEDQVRRLPVPVLVVHGGHDAPARARPVAEFAPDGRWAELPGSAHSPWLEEPHAVRELVRGFIAELS